MHTFRSITITVGVFALLGGVGWLAIQPSTEVKSGTPIASIAVPSEAKKPATILTPKTKEAVTKPTPTQEPSAPSADTLTPRPQERIPSAPPQAPAPRQDPILNAQLTTQLNAAVEQTLEELSADGEEEIIVVSANCQVPSCQLDLISPDAETISSFLIQLPFTLGWSATAQMEHVANPDGSVSTTIYLERDYAGPAEY